MATGAAYSLQVERGGWNLGTFVVRNGNVVFYGDGGTDLVTIRGIQGSANTFTLNGSTATLSSASLPSSTITVALNGISGVTLQGGTQGNSFTNTAATVPSVLNGIGGANTFTFAGNSMGAPATIGGGGNTNTLYAPTLSSNQSNVWSINGLNQGNLNGSNWTFTGVQNLVGGANDDLFQFSGTGWVNSANGNGAYSTAGDILDYSAYPTTVKVNMAVGVATGVGVSWSNIQTVIGQSSPSTPDTLISPNTTNNWNITGPNSGTVNALAFSGFGNLTGGSAADTFTVGSGGSLTGTLSGGGGNDTLVGPNVPSTFNITGSNMGNLGGTVLPSFTAIKSLTGGTQPNDFVFSKAAYITGNITGGSGGDTLDLSAYTTAVTLNLQTGVATGVGGTATNLAVAIGGSAANTLTGANVAASWNITGSNAGNINNSFTFSQFGNLVGGTGVDVFTFSSAGTVAAINGGGAPANQGDWLDYSSFTTPVTVNLTAGTATNVNSGKAGAVRNIQNVHGGNGGNTLTGNAQGNVLIGGSGANTITGGSGRSMLIADAGPSNIIGGSSASPTGGDILIAGSTSYDSMTTANEAALMSILAEWQSADSYDTRFLDINTGSGGGLNGTNKLNYGTTVFDNGQVNTLTALGGTAPVDWFFANLAAGHTTIRTTQTGYHINNS